MYLLPDRYKDGHHVALDRDGFTSQASWLEVWHVLAYAIARD
jgi:hypothetical protein